ncbi:hypothetical protein [Mucilaginibacter sp.]|uniref:hypothetical protein n=1 Tax=Mucilaginibacter sp. TaxID=1882438 RepID=UPI0025E7CF32|nr:hypothetical protein [Mucilaginibacter sp.]
MLKQLTAWLLIFSVLAVNYSRLFVYAGFKMNQSYIAAKLCENRNKPFLHCNGKCYLMKKIKQAEDKQNNAESQAQKSLFQDGYIVNTFFHNSTLWSVGIGNAFPFAENCGKLPGAFLPIFRPPQLS